MYDSALIIAAGLLILSVWSLILWVTKKTLNILFVLGVITVAAIFVYPSYNSPPATLIPVVALQPGNKAISRPTIEYAFSPNQGASSLITQKINAANKSIKVAAYSFTYAPIAEALRNAQKRGVDVKVVLDRKQLNDKHSVYRYLIKHNIQTKINNSYAIMHHKFMLIDDIILQTGSFNYSKSAENKNAENVLVITGDSKIAKAYSKQWQVLWNESE